MEHLLEGDGDDVLTTSQDLSISGQAGHNAAMQNSLEFHHKEA